MDKNSIVALYDTHVGAEQAAQELQRAGFDLTKLSIVGRDHHTEQNEAGYYSAGDRIKYWDRKGASWDGVWGFLEGAAFFVLPGIGPVLIGGPLVRGVVAALDGADAGEDLSAVGAGLFSLGISRRSIQRCEAAVKADKFLLVAHGSSGELLRAKDILHSTGPDEVSVHFAEEHVWSHG
jgi:hypothetical protein